MVESDSDYTEEESDDSVSSEYVDGDKENAPVKDKRDVLQRIDLIGDFGGRELFVIDGDSLLAYFLLTSAARDNFLSPLHRRHRKGQIVEESCVLYALYLIERFIEAVRQRGGCFHLVFFEQTGHALYQDDFRLAAFREILRRHLQFNSDHKIFCFQSWSDDQEWLEHVSKFRPLFVMTYGPLAVDQLGVDLEFQEYSLCNEAFVADCLQKKISVAFMPDLVLQGGRIVAYVEYYHNKYAEKTITSSSNSVSAQNTLSKIESREKECQRLVDELTSMPGDLMGHLPTNKVLLDCRLKFTVWILILNQKVLFSSPLDTIVGKTLLLHSLILSTLPLTSRCFRQIAVHDSVRQAVHRHLMDFYRIVYHLLHRENLIRTSELNSKELTRVNIYDLVDERLLTVLVQMLVNGELPWDKLDEDLRGRYEEEWQMVLKALGKDGGYSASFEFEIEQLKDLKFTNTELILSNDVLNDVETDGFLTIQNELFKEFVTSEAVVVKNGNSTSPDDFDEELITGFAPENVHIHVYKELEIEKEEMDWKKRKQLQKYIAFVHRYADSLTGVKGLYNKVIVPKTRTGEDPKKKKNQSGSSMKLQADNQRRLDEQRFLKAAELLKALRTHLQTVSNAKEKLSQVKAREIKIKEFGNDQLWFATQWLKLQILVNDWIDSCQNRPETDSAGNVEPRESKAANLLEQLGIISNQCGSTLAIMPELLPELNGVCRLMGFPELFQAHMFTEENKTDSKKDAKKKQQEKKASGGGKKKGGNKGEELNTTNAPKPVSRNKDFFPTLKMRTRETTAMYEVGMSLPQFQLKYLGGYMNRCNASGTVEDSRVPFRPDDWQVELLDIVDRGESALICAPTSSGKTYVAYYAMEKIISENDEDIVVYVAPTKALVNQVATEVYARFKKTYPKGGQNVWGNWTMEYNYYPMECQILVTVPEMLEVLLLAPSHLEWSRRIKRVIFDEIHCMGQLDGGRVWEHLLLMCTMPVLCLSATLGSPELFQSWLQSIQARHNIKVHLVKCAQRHSDLAKFKYEFPTPRDVAKKRRPRQKGAFVAVHPWGSLTANMVLQSGIPESAKLSPEECLLVAETLRSDIGNSASSLFPEKYFDAGAFIKRKQVFDYERALKTYVTDMARNEPENFQKIIDSLSGRKVVPPKSAAGVMEPSVFERDSLPAIANLAFDLRDQGMLPAICFTFSRQQIETMAKSLTNVLMSVERLLRKLDPDFERKKAIAINEQEARMKMKKKASAQEMSRQKKDHASGDVEDDRPVFDYNKPHPYCTFVGRNHSVSEDDLESYISDFEWKLRGEHSFLVEAMRRGIAVHHAGMMTKYRTAVEALMRSGYLTLVFGSSTLALGINMPCRTAVFIGDSIDLTSSEYQQMSGRAGRRGFDQEGYVVFADIQQVKIDRLMCSELPALSGHFPLTTTLVIRMLLLLTQAVPMEDPDLISARKRREAIAESERHKKDLAQAQIIVRNLTLNSLFSMGKVISGNQTVHYLGASVTYLRQQELVDTQGFLVDHSGMAINLYSMEPANLATIILLKNGVFLDACKDLDENPDEAIFKLAFLLCHLFNRVTIPLHKVSALREIAGNSPSNIFLDPLPKKIVQLINTHNKGVLDIYQHYCKKAADSDGITSEPDRKCFLSTSRVPFLESSKDASPYLSAALASKTHGDSSATMARSPFSSLSGKTPHFESLDDMLANARESIHLEASAIPILSTADGQAGRLNAYILDFLKHGQLSVIEKDNCIKEGDSWELLRNFLVALEAICTSLKADVEPPPPPAVVEDPMGMPELRVIKPVAVPLVEAPLIVRGFEALRVAFEKQFSKHT